MAANQSIQNNYYLIASYVVGLTFTLLVDLFIDETIVYINKFTNT